MFLSYNGDTVCVRVLLLDLSSSTSHWRFLQVLLSVALWKYNICFWLMIQVQAVLLLLGGYEVPAGVPSVGGMPAHNHRVFF